MVWLPTVAVAGCLAIFAATVLPYFEAYRGYTPFALGVVAASILGGSVTYVLAPPGQYRVARAVGSGIAVALSFGFMFLFLVLNTVGS